MNSSATNLHGGMRAKRVRVTDQTVTIELRDGRSISLPTRWYPRLLHGTPAERAKIEIWDDGLYWPKLNADISYRAALLGEKSGESPTSLRRWLEYRARGETEPIPTLPLPPELAKLNRRGRKRRPGVRAST